MSSVTHPFLESCLMHWKNMMVKVSIGGRQITNLCFADNALAEEEQKFKALIKSLDKTCTCIR